MPSPINITNIPAPRVEFIDPRTGLMSREWYRFFLNLFNLTGAGTNDTSLSDLQIGPPVYDLTGQIAQISDSAQLAAMSDQAEAVLGQLGIVYDQAQLASMIAQYEQATLNLQNQFDTLPAAPQLGTIASYNLDGSPTAGGVGYGTGSAVAFTPAGTSGQFLTSAAAGTPTWTTPSSVAVTSFSAGTTGFTPSSATTGAVTLAGTLAVANGGTSATTLTGYVYGNGTGAMTASASIPATVLSGTIAGDRGVTAGSTSSSFVEYNGTTATAGQFDGGVTVPTGSTRLNYGGWFYPTFLNLVGSADTATAATHYFVETATDGFVRPKTIANVRTEIVTNAAVLAGIGTLPVANGGTGTSTAFTAGSVLFAGASGVYSQDNAQLFWDDTNNRLGIGASTPSQKLTIIGNQFIAGTDDNTYAPASITITNNGSSGGLGGSPAALIAGIAGAALNTGVAYLDTLKAGVGALVPLAFRVNGTEQMRIDTAGNVGIGSASPAYKLDVAGIVRTTGQFISTQANSATTGGGQIYLSGTGGNRIDFINQGAAAPAFTTRSAGTKIVLFPAVDAVNTDYALGISSNVFWSSIPGSTRSFVWYAGTTVVFAVKGNGEVISGNGDTSAAPVSAVYRATDGVGTDIAGANLSIQGGRGTGAGAGGYVRFLTAPAGTAGTTLGTATERMRIDSTGNVGIGTSAPDYKLKIEQGLSNNNNGLFISNTNYGSMQGLNISMVNAGLSNFNSYAVIKGYKSGVSGTTNISLQPDEGKVGIGTTTPGYLLDVYGNVDAGSVIRTKNANAGTSAYSALFVGNDTANVGVLFLNSSTRTADGGVNTATLRNDAGDLRLQASGSVGIQIAATTGNVGIGTATNLSTLTVNGSFASKSPSTVNAATYTVVATDGSLRFTTTNCTVTLPAAASFPGRILYLNTITANSVISAASNVIPLGSNTAGTAILAATAAKFAMIQSNGTNWITMMAN